MEGYDASTYGERWAEVYDDWYDDPAETAAIVGRIRSVAGDPASASTILELGIGTGLLALPLAEAGYDIRGVDASPAMLARLRAKPGGEHIPVALGDMAAVPVPGPEPTAVGGAFLAANTFFGLSSEAAQRACLRRLAAVVEPGGWLVIAAFVPADPDELARSSSVAVRSLTADQLVLTADVVDADAQTVSGQFIDISASGIQLRPFHLRYLFPDQLDELARGTGWQRQQRWGSWAGDPFGPDSTMHVSRYRNDGEAPG